MPPISDCCSPKGYRTIFSARSAEAEARRYRRRGLDRLSRRVVDLLLARGVQGRTLLEVGGGIGAIQIELLTSGSAAALNVELTPTYEQAAAELLRGAGLEGRSERRLGDFVETAGDVAAADFVVLNRVICCYPDMPRLVAAASRHAERTLVLSFPNSRWSTRLALAAANLGFRVMRLRFKIFVHPPQLILAMAQRDGLKCSFNHRGLLWQTIALDRSA